MGEVTRSLMVTFLIAVGKINLTLPSLTFLSAVSASKFRDAGRIIVL
jgi:hypothetical protein